MSAALRTSTLLRASSRVPIARSFHGAAVRLAGKESHLHNENRAEEAEAVKQQQLREQKAGKGEWKDALASDSESAIKADRGEHSHGKGTIEELQRESAQAAQRERK